MEIQKYKRTKIQKYKRTKEQKKINNILREQYKQIRICISIYIDNCYGYSPKF
jgi:hypothetical protein